MNRTMLVAACALAVGLGTVLAPNAAAQDIGLREYPCSDQFRVPWALDAWNGINKVAFSPFGSDNIHCVSFHGMTAIYQLDPQGRKHALNPPSAFSIGAFARQLYFWDSATY
ncbi:hypothetical protein ACGFIU_09015 [Rhodococcus oryzae]|uniref:hypothetical protein n=1 Tax=Rhodococcus oryzae TaxID=2571143 RepID=UPI00371B3881